MSKQFLRYLRSNSTLVIASVVLFSSILALLSGVFFGDPTIANAAQSRNLDTNMTTYFGSGGDEETEATAIGNDNTVWFGGSISNTAVNYGKTPINILGGGAGTLMQYESDGKTLRTVLRFPSAVKDISLDRNVDRMAIIGDFGLVYMNTTNYSVIWNKTLPTDSAANPENYKIGSRVDIGATGKIGTLYGKRITVWDQLGTNLSGAGNFSFGIAANILTDIAMVDANNSVVVIGEVQKNGGPCIQWRAPIMKSFGYTGTLIWDNYNFSQYNLKDNGTDYCPDAMPQRLTMGGDGNLYMVAESAGGNPVFNSDPRTLGVTLTSQGKDAGGDTFNNTANMSSQHVSFMLKYNPSTGIPIKKQIFTSRLPSTSANTLYPNDIAVNESGVIGFVGRAAAYFPDRLDVQVLNGVTVPIYGNGGGGDGFYIELAPDMRTRIRATAIKNTGESNPRGVAMKGNKRVVGGRLGRIEPNSANNQIAGTIPTKNPTQPTPRGGITEGFGMTWGFETPLQDYSITATKTPSGTNPPLNSTFSVAVNYSYSGLNAANDAIINFVVPQGINYTNELFDGVTCIMVGTKKDCSMIIPAASWQAGGSKSFDFAIPRVLESSVFKDINFVIKSVPPITTEIDPYPNNNIAAIPMEIDDTLPTTPDYSIVPTMVTTGTVGVGGYAEVNVKYLYEGPLGASDKRLRVTVPIGMEYDPLNRAGMQCTITSGQEVCYVNLLQSNLSNGGSITIYFRAKSPYSGTASKSFVFELYNTLGTPVDSITSNHTNQVVSVQTVTVVATSDYGVAVPALTNNNIGLNQALVLPVNIKYVGNSSPISQKIIATIPAGFSYNYIANDGWSCVTTTGIQTCQKTITSQEWVTATSSNGLNLNLNLKSDAAMSSPAQKTISFKLALTSKSGEVDTTIPNNSASIILTLDQSVQATSSSSSIGINSSSNVASSSSIALSSSSANALSSSSVMVSSSSAPNLISSSSAAVSSSSTLPSSSVVNSSSAAVSSSSTINSSSSSVLGSSSIALSSSSSVGLSSSSANALSSSSVIVSSSSANAMASSSIIASSSSVNANIVSSSSNQVLSSSSIIVSSSSTSPSTAPSPSSRTNSSSSSSEQVSSSSILSSSSTTSNSSIITSSSSSSVNSSSNSSNSISNITPTTPTIPSIPTKKYDVNFSSFFNTGKKAIVEVLNSDCTGLSDLREFVKDITNYVQFRATCSNAVIKTYWNDLSIFKSYRMQKYNISNGFVSPNYPATIGLEFYEGRFVVVSTHTVQDNSSGDSDNTSGNILDPYTLVETANSQVVSSSINNLLLPGQSTSTSNAPLAQNSSPISIVTKNATAPSTSTANNLPLTNQTNPDVLAQSVNSNIQAANSNNLIRTGGGSIIAVILGSISFLLVVIILITNLSKTSIDVED